MAALVLNAASFTVAYWPRRLFPLLIWTVAKLLKTVARKDLVRLRENIELIYRLPASSHFHEMFVGQVIRHQVAAVFETIRGIKRPQELNLLGFDLLKKQIAKFEAQKAGIIIITAHLGSWELVAQASTAAASHPMKVLAKRSKNSSMTDYLDRLRQAMGVEVLWTDRKDLIRAMLGAIKSRCLLWFCYGSKAGRPRRTHR